MIVVKRLQPKSRVITKAEMVLSPESFIMLHDLMVHIHSSKTFKKEFNDLMKEMCENTGQATSSFS